MHKDHHQPAVQAFIFDLDDTLAWTAALWREAEEHLLHALGASWSAELAAQYKGMNALDVASTIHRQLQPSLPEAECRRIMRDRLIENFHRLDIRPIDGAPDLVRRCAALGLPMAVASGSPMPAIRRALDALALRDHFQLTVSSEQVARGKPHPDVFLAVAAQLNVPPAACLVFEDSLIGAQAAREARMRCVVRPSLADPRLSTITTEIVTDWAQVTTQALTHFMHPRP